MNQIKNYQHQDEAIEKFKEKEFFALFCDMGTGKTRIAIKIAEYKFKKGDISAVLIIAPNHVHHQWIHEQLPIHCSIPYTAFVWETSKMSAVYRKNRLNDFLISETDKLKIFACNVEAFQGKPIIPVISELVHNHDVFTIVDESTRIKTPKAKRSQIIHRLNKYGHRAILTGTPTAKSPFDLWSQFEFLKADYFKCNYFIFQHRYGILQKGTNHYTGANYHTLIDEKAFNTVKYKLKETDNDYEAVATIMGISEANVKFIASQDQFTRFKRIDELKQYIEDDIFSITKEECLDLPEKIYEHIYIELTPEQKKVYKNLRTQLLAQYANKELSVVNKISLTTRLMQICGGFFPYKEDGSQKIMSIGKVNPKLERLKEDLEETNGQVIIWAQFVKELELLYNELKKDYSCRLYYGKTGKYQREQIIKEFKAGDFQIFIGNPSTAGFGLNLQNSSMQYFFSNSFRTENRLQAEDRSHRIGQKSICVYKDIIAKNTIDEKVFKVLSEGKDLNDFFKSNSLGDILADGAD